MGLEIRKGRNNKLRPDWYGRYESKGRRHTVNLGVKIAGIPPASLSLRDLGDPVFEASRARAQAKLDRIVEEARIPVHAAHLARRVHETQLGEKIDLVALEDLPEAWGKIRRRRPLAPRSARMAKAKLASFVEFVHEQNPWAKDVSEITRTMAGAYMDAQESRGVAPKTYNNILKLLRSAFKQLLPEGYINPFSGIPTKEPAMVHRQPFTPEELKAILEAAQDDDFTRPIIVTGICTAMRLGDCCQLEWKSVDLDGRFITVKTSKTGQEASIPILPMLYEELSRLQPKGQYVFPEQANAYQAGRVTYRIRKVFAAAGFRDAEDGEEVRGEIHQQREQGLHRASVRDFHSFRVTWVTLALTAGIPLELVQKVTGHQTTAIVMRHYFRPGREDFRQALQSAMPQLLMNGAKSREDQLREIVAGMTAESWEDDQGRLLALLGQNCS